jgi:hypothetical protein
MLNQQADVDPQSNPLEYEWRNWYEGCIIARAEYRALSADVHANADLLDAARERLDRAEAVRAKVMATIERSGGWC